MVNNVGLWAFIVVFCVRLPVGAVFRLLLCLILVLDG